MPPPYRAVLVAAVSTPAQAAEDRESIPEQLAEDRAAAQRLGAEVVAEIVIPGHSREYWSLDELCADCREYRQIIDLVTSERANLVICMRLVRFCRTTPLLVQVMDVLVQHAAQVYATREPQDLMPPDKVRRRRGLRAVFDYLHMALSEEEQQVRVERLRQGMTRRIKSGLPAHSRRGHYGYTAPALSGQLPTPDPVEAPWARWIFDRRCQGWSYRRCATYLNDHGVKSPNYGCYRRDRGVLTAMSGRWHDSEISYLVHNPLYAGIVRWGDLSNDNGRHEALVDYDTWLRAQRVGTSPTKRAPHILTGLAYCALCGHRMTYVTYDVSRGKPGRRNPSLRCGHYASAREDRCVSNAMPAAKVEAAVLHVVCEVLADPARYAAYTAPVEGTAAERELLERNLARLEGERERWARAYGAGAIDLPEFTERRRGLDRQAANVAAEIAARERRAASHAHGEERIRGLAERLDALDEYTPAELNGLLRLIVDRVECRQRTPPVVTLL